VGYGKAFRGPIGISYVIMPHVGALDPGTGIREKLDFNGRVE